MNKKGFVNILVIIGVVILVGVTSYFIVSQQIFSPEPSPSPIPSPMPTPAQNPSSSPTPTQNPNPSPTSTPNPTSTSQSGIIKVRLLNAFSGQTIPNADVRIYSDNGIRCFTTPCNTEGQEWTGKSDNGGVILIPLKVINVVTTITAIGYKSGRDLNKDSEKIDNNEWLIELDPDNKIDNFERRLKLIDSQTQKPLSDTTLWITNSQDCHPTQCPDYSFTGTTNAQGNIYYRISSIKNNSWIFVNNYKVVKFPTGWVNFKVILERE